MNLAGWSKEPYCYRRGKWMITPEHAAWALYDTVAGKFVASSGDIMWLVSITLR